MFLFSPFNFFAAIFLPSGIRKCVPLTDATNTSENDPSPIDFSMVRYFLGNSSLEIAKRLWYWDGSFKSSDSSS